MVKSILSSLAALPPFGKRQTKHLRISAKDKCVELQRLLALLIDGYNAALETDTPRLEQYIATNGICEARVLYEGAAAAKVSRSLTGQADWTSTADMLTQVEPYAEATLGLGFGAALCHLNLWSDLLSDSENPYWIWMALDSYGFNQGVFRWSSAVSGCNSLPHDLPELGRHAFDQGLGRALWWICGADPRLMSDTINSFDVARRGDLWRGIGLMVSYWGMLDHRDLKRLINWSGPERASLQQGVALAATLRVDGHILDFTEGACEIICGLSTVDSAALAHSCMPMEAWNGQTFYKWQNKIASVFDDANRN